MVFPPISNFAVFLRLFSIISKSYSDISKKFTKSKIIISKLKNSSKYFSCITKQNYDAFCHRKIRDIPYNIAKPKETFKLEQRSE